MAAMETRKEIPPEYLSEDILDEDFVKIYLHVYSLQFLLGSSRVHIKNRFVTPPTSLQKCYTVICSVVSCAFLYIVKLVFYDMMPNKSVIFIGMLVLTSNYVTALCNTVHARFINGRQNTDFFVKIQKLDRFMINIKKRKQINSLMEYSNSIYVILVLIFFTFIIVMICATRQFNALIFSGMGFSHLCFIFELIVCSSIVVYLFLRVRFVNFLIESYLQQNDNGRKPTILSTPTGNKFIRFVPEDAKNDFITSEAHIYLKEIFSCFAMFQDLYKFQILLFCLKLVIISLMSFEIVLNTLANDIYNPSQVIPLIVLMIIDLFIAIILAYRFGIFFAEVKETKRLCIAVMALHQEGNLWEKAKAMLDMIDETPPRFSVYGMWDMNPGMFITIFGLVTSLFVTLTQFHYL